MLSQGQGSLPLLLSLATFSEKNISLTHICTPRLSPPIRYLAAVGALVYPSGYPLNVALTEHKSHHGGVTHPPFLFRTWGTGHRRPPSTVQAREAHANACVLDYPAYHRFQFQAASFWSHTSSLLKLMPRQKCTMGFLVNNYESWKDVKKYVFRASSVEMEYNTPSQAKVGEGNWSQESDYMTTGSTQKACCKPPISV